MERLLKRKAVLAYATLAEDAFLNGNYGQALGFIKCLITFFKNLNESIDEIRSYILGRAGDCCCRLAQKWSDIQKQQKDYMETSQNNSIPKKNLEEISKFNNHVNRHYYFQSMQQTLDLTDFRLTNTNFVFSVIWEFSLPHTKVEA